MEINERIGNVQGKTATLHYLGIIYANKGDVDEAIARFIELTLHKLMRNEGDRYQAAFPKVREDK